MENLNGKHLFLSLWYNSGDPAFSDAPELGNNPHAQEAMRHLGIEYDSCQPQSIADGWHFMGCRNVPDKLPGWLTVVQ